MGARYWPQRSSQQTGPGLPIGTKTSPSEPAKRHATQHQGTSTIIRDNNPTKPKQRQHPHLYPKGPFHTALSANIQGGAANGTWENHVSATPMRSGGDSCAPPFPMQALHDHTDKTYTRFFIRNIGNLMMRGSCRWFLEGSRFYTV